jgi:hypothetical protein
MLFQIRLVAAFNRSPVRIAAFQIDFTENERLALVSPEWLNVSHTIGLRNACGHSGNCGADAKHGKPYARQAKVADGDWGTIYKVCHGVLLLRGKNDTCGRAGPWGGPEEF